MSHISESFGGALRSSDHSEIDILIDMEEAAAGLEVQLANTEKMELSIFEACNKDVIEAMEMADAEKTTRR